ncbi:hypothetical protein M405DRAFT_864901 [Rhizopogon salebrosus TDB-379]|nr:hypothetical protein M405DRAFT_864901 [Rhizopogon salebrosus TDB-379]
MKDHITAAIDYAIDAVNSTASQNVPGSGRMFLNVPHFSTEHEGCYHPTLPSIAPQSPRSPSPIPALNKGKGHEDPEDDEEELEYYSPKAPSPSLPPPIFLADPSPIPLALTTLIKTAPSSPLTPALSTPDEWLFSDPPHSDPAFENVVCRLPNFFFHLDKWEKDDDRNFFKISSFLHMSAPPADYGPLTIARLKELTGLGESPEQPIEVD